MNKAVVLHLDKSSEPLRTKLNLLESLYTIWYLQKIKGIDIIVHSVHHGGQFFQDKNIGNIGIKKVIELGDDFKVTIKCQFVYFTRLYSFLNPTIQSYDEVIMYDNDFTINDFSELQRLMDVNIDEMSYGMGKKYVNKKEMECVRFGFFKINMKLFKTIVSDENLKQVLLDYEKNEWENYEECVFPELVRRFGGNISEFLESPYADYRFSKGTHRCMVHYGWSKSLSHKIRHTLLAISNKEFVDWICSVGIASEFNSIVEDIIDGILKKYDKQFEVENGN